MNFNINSIFSENTKNSINIFLNKHKLAMNQNDTTLFTCQLAMIRNHFKSKVDEANRIVSIKVCPKDEYRKIAILNDRLDKYASHSLLMKNSPTFPPQDLYSTLSYLQAEKKHHFNRQGSFNTIFAFMLWSVFFGFLSTFEVLIGSFVSNVLSIELSGGVWTILALILMVISIILVYLYSRFGLYNYRRQKVIDDAYDKETQKHSEEAENSRSLLTTYVPALKEIEAFLNNTAAQEKEAIPTAYWGDANTIYDLIVNRRADSLKEAINLTETLKHQQRLEENQQRSVMISQAAYDAALNAQADARNAQLAAEEAAREANAAARSADHANDFIAWM